MAYLGATMFAACNFRDSESLRASRRNLPRKITSHGYCRVISQQASSSRKKQSILAAVSSMRKNPKFIHAGI
jgi:hypothetical protein